MDINNLQNKISLWHFPSQKFTFLFTFILIPLLVFIFTACDASPLFPTITGTPQKQLSVSPQVVATAWTAELIGRLSIMDGCIRVIENDKNVSYLLVWPPDINETIDKDTVLITTGIVTGNHKVIALHDGEEVRFSGGETTQPDSMIQPKCKGPYWEVGFEIRSENTQNGSIP